MDDLEKIAKKIEQEQRIQLSSDFTKVGAITGIIAGVGAAVFFSYEVLTISGPLQWNKLLAGVLGFVLFFLTLYQLMYAAEADLKGKKLNIKKVIGKSYEIDVNQVTKLSSFNSKSTKYTLVRFTAPTGKLEKALILNNNSILLGREIVAGDVIKLAQQIRN